MASEKKYRPYALWGVWIEDAYEGWWASEPFKNYRRNVMDSVKGWRKIPWIRHSGAKVYAKRVTLPPPDDWRESDGK